MRRFLFLLLAASALPVSAQTVDVTFRGVPRGFTPDRAFVPGTFNNWGQPHTGGCIAVGNASEMAWIRSPASYWLLTVPLEIGTTYQYKFQTQPGSSGQTCEWFSDPFNPVTNPADNNNSVLVVADPMAFQITEELSGSGGVQYFAATLVSSQAITAISYTVNGVTRTDGMDHFTPETGVFRYRPALELRSGAQFIIDATDAGSRTIHAEIGEIQPPVDWLYSAYSTVKDAARLKAQITRLDGSIDPAVTSARLLSGGNDAGMWPVTNGLLDIQAPVDMGANTFSIEATVDGQAFTSADLVITRRLHPLEDRLVDTVTASGSGFQFTAEMTLASVAIIPELIFEWRFDDQLSTAGLTSGHRSGLMGSTFNGTADGSGELYFDVFASDTSSPPGSGTFERRVAVVVEKDGSAREMAWDENAEWTKRAVVYEVFPLKFGPTSSGTPTNPSNRLKQITAELDYVAAMGFTAIWFMPVFDDQYMNAISGGYNIRDFYTIDPAIGTNADFRALVDRAHELGIRIVLDMTPNHTSPVHPWVESLREDGPFASYFQTTPSNHNRGLDGRGANLPEIWQVEGGQNIYRKYDGFGDLANVDWDDDDLQAAMLDIFAHWMREFDVDGWRLDVYWGPWRRYGPERFGRPLRDIVKRLRPDAWLLGEIAGTGGGTEVYYADDENGTKVVGGLDAAYDWTFYHNGVRGSYGALADYNARALNGNFWPGPNARYFRFLENHDENRIAYVQRANPDRIRSLTGWLLTTTGVPMVYAGQEVGFGAAHDYTQRDPVSWNTPNNGQLAALYQRLSRARGHFPAFWTQELSPVFIGNSFRGEPLVYAYARPYLDENALVAVNFGNVPATFTMNPSSAMRMSTDGPIPYHDLAADTSAAYLGEFTVTIAPFETVVYITSTDSDFEMPTLPKLPFGAVYTGVFDGDNTLPDQVRLRANYPNPFNPTTAISFDLPDAGRVQLEVFDMLGRRVAVLANGLFAPGTHEARFDAGTLPSGAYLYRLEAAGRVITRTMVLVK